MRETYEREAGHIEGTRHVSLNELTGAAEHVPAIGRSSSTAAWAPARRWPRRRSGRPALTPTRCPAGLLRWAAEGRPLIPTAATSPITRENRRKGSSQMSSAEYPEVRKGEGYAVGHLDDLGSGHGFRKVRKGLGVDRLRRQRDRDAARLPDRLSLPRRAGRALLRPRRRDGDGVRRRLCLAAAGRHLRARGGGHTLRRLRNVGQGDAVYLCAGGKDGYVGRDGKLPEGEQRVSGPHGAA